MTSFAIAIGEEKGHSLAAPKGVGSDGSLKILSVVALAISHKPAPGSCRSVTTLCRFFQLRDPAQTYANLG